MDIKIRSIEIDTQTIAPTLTIRVEITYYSRLEIPVSISGKINAASGKTIAYTNEFYARISEKQMDIYPMSEKEKDTIFSGGNKFHNEYNATLSATLSHAAIDHIELYREKDHEKAVRFNFEFLLKKLEFISDPTERSTIRMQTSGGFEHFVINQSDWVKKYSPLLGIGNFLLLELQIPDKHTVSADWTALYDRLALRLKEMEEAIRQGDWQKTMDRSRQFYEALKISDGKDGHKKFDEELRKLFLKDQHSDEGIQNFLDSIWNFFEYNSKFVHDNDKKGNLKPIPVTTKEDAYFAYALGVGLLNIIGKKTSKLR